MTFLQNILVLLVVTQLILNVCVKVIILLTLNRSRRIISCVLLGVLFTCVLLGLSSAPVYASSEDSFTPLESSEDFSFDLVVPTEYLDPVYDKLAAGDVRATTYTTTDIYNFLYDSMRGESYSSSYSLPRIASFTDRIAQTLYGSGQAVPSVSLWSRVNSIYNKLLDFYSAVVDGTSSNIPVGPGIRQMLYGIDSQANWETLFDVDQDSRDLLQLIYAMNSQIHGDGQNNSYYLNSINSSVSTISSSITSLDSLTWYSTSSTYKGTSLGLNNTYLTSNTDSSTFYSTFTLGGYSSPCIWRIKFPFLRLQPSYKNVRLTALYYTNDFQTYTEVALPDNFVMHTDNGTYVYLFDFQPRSYDFVFKFENAANFRFNPTYSTSVSAIPFDTDDYQQITQAFYAMKSANNITLVSDSVKSLADYIVSPEKQAAENASQAVIDDTLDGFTGSGSAAAKTSDTGSMKNMSGSIQSGLNSGASASNAASVFSNQTFWSWFTQATSNGINNPYPAPVVQNVRGSGDDVPDFLSGNQAELNELLNQRNSW